MPPIHVALAAFVMLIWGGNFVVVKFGLLELPPLFFSMLRFLAVAAILAPFTRIPKDMILSIFLYATLLGTLHFALMFIALETIDVTAASILIQIQTPFAMLVSALVWRDYPGWRRIAGACLAFVGVMVIVGEPRFSGGLLPVAMVIGAAMAWAIANIMMKRIGSRVGGFALNGWMSVFAAIELTAVSFIFEGNQWPKLMDMSAIGWGAIFYQSVMVVILGYGLWYWMLRQHSVSQMIPITLSLPFLGILGGVVFLDEVLTWQLVLGGALTIAGVAVIVLREAGKSKHSGPPPK